MNTTAKSHPLARLFGYAQSHRQRVIFASLFSVLNKVVDLAPPTLIGAAVDIVVQQDQSFFAQLGFEEPISQLYVLAAITIVIWVLESTFEYIHQVIWRNLAQSMEHDLRTDTYDHVQGLDLAYFEDQSTGGLMAILNDDINQLERFLDNGANAIIQVVTTVASVECSSTSRHRWHGWPCCRCHSSSRVPFGFSGHLRQDTLRFANK